MVAASNLIVFKTQHADLRLLGIRSCEGEELGVVLGDRDRVRHLVTRKKEKNNNNHNVYINTITYSSSSSFFFFYLSYLFIYWKKVIKMDMKCTKASDRQLSVK